MLCAHCGADTPPELDLCVVCRTPHGEGVTVAGTPNPDLDLDLTRPLINPGQGFGTGGFTRASTSSLLPGQAGRGIIGSAVQPRAKRMGGLSLGHGIPGGIAPSGGTGMPRRCASCRSSSP